MSVPYSSGTHDKSTSWDTIRRRHDIHSTEPSELSEEIDEIILKTNSLKIKEISSSIRYQELFIKYFNPIVLTILSAYVRLYDLHKQNRVVWDEAHFGKFGSYYIKNEFYFDVHPPLGKLLVGLSGYLANYDGSFSFDSGLEYPETCNFILMRCFNCVFGILCTPLAYKTCVELGFSQLTTWFVTLLVIFEMISLTLSKFILLDSMLLFFTVLSYYCLIKLHNLRLKNALLTFKGTTCLIMTGVSIGCVCSVKWVGLFVTALVGFYVIYDLLIKTYQLTSTKTLSFKAYSLHWISRILTLIVIPFFIYAACFKVHFTFLSRSGTGDGSISTLLQATLVDNTLTNGPRSIAFGSLVTLRSQGLSPNLLHSHGHLYPEGSMQQQVTTYGFKDLNNDFVVEFDLDHASRGMFASEEVEENSTAIESLYTTIVKHGDTIRLMHKDTGCFLHSHSIQAPVLKGNQEISCYGSMESSDSKDEWVIEIQTQDVSPSHDFANENADEVHPVSTNFRLRHKVLGCYLSTTGYALPSWGFQQGEVSCKNSVLSSDKGTWWNIEDHKNDKLEQPTIQYVAPKPKFWKEFILLNYGMMASNNALIPDPNKYDKLSSEWWEWPILNSGLRMCSWSSTDVKYFLMGHPFITWFSTATAGVFVLYCVAVLFQWQRQIVKYGIFEPNWNTFLAQGILPFLGWILHYLPFIVMGRVTYLHHYVPALYFAIFVSGFAVESLVVKKLHRYLSCAIYFVLYALILGIFWKYKDLSLGMLGSSKGFAHLKLLGTWMI